MVFRKAILWHKGSATILRRFKEIEIERESSRLKWKFSALAANGSPIEVTVDAQAPVIHELPYAKTDCSGTFPVSNASFANAVLRFGKNAGEVLETAGGAVLEMGGA
jgi:hypothetical protein